MAADTAVELKRHNVASIAIWPGPVETEIIQASDKAEGVNIIMNLFLNFFKRLFNSFVKWSQSSVEQNQRNMLVVLLLI